MVRLLFVLSSSRVRVCSRRSAMMYEESSGCGRESRILLCSKLSRVWAFGLGKCMGVCKKIQNFLPGPLNREQLDRRYYGG
jgi:hypothetical protein